MNREILFRGKTPGGNWVRGLLSISKEKDSNHYITNSAGMPFAFQVLPETIGQFTGLNDKNGTKIFEGDIDSLGRQVVFRDGAFHFSHDDQVNASNCLSQYRCNYVEIVGNIHDNPKLLQSAT